MIVRGVEESVLQPNTRSNTKVAKPSVFDRIAGKVLRFLIVYELFVRMKMRNNTVKEQIQ